MNKTDTDEPVFTVVIPNSLGQRHLFTSLQEVNTFLNSPTNKPLNNSIRFKKCKDSSEVDSFYEQFANFSLSDSTTSIANSAVADLTPLFAEPKPQLLNRFRSYIEKGNQEAFEEAIEENPRYILNTSVDGATILQGSQRHNVLHIACSYGNLKAVQHTLRLINSPDFLEKAYGKVPDVQLLIDHLLDAFINTPDKLAHNTPLHFACKKLHLDIVSLLLSYDICKRNPVNKFDRTPHDLATEAVKDNPEAKRKLAGICFSE